MFIFRGFWAAALGLAACQTYDFEPLQPVVLVQHTTKVNKAGRVVPNLMLVVDRSGSMRDPVSPGLAACQCGSGGTCGVGGCDCPAGCPTRMSEVKSAMGSFLSAHGSEARFGLAPFPAASSGVCAPGRVAVGLPSAVEPKELSLHAQGVAQALEALVPEGGTPIGGTLEALFAEGSLRGEGRPSYVLLLTDGLPNCNPDAFVGLGATCVCASCGCVTGSCQSANCLDQERTVKSVARLFAAGVGTFVVGFGEDLGSGAAKGVLNALAVAGGHERRCQSSADCGALDACEPATQRCGRAFYRAQNREELAAVLSRIGQLIAEPPCVVRLSAPPQDPRLLAVLVRGESVASGPDTWAYEGGDRLTLLGRLCQEVVAASTDQPVPIEVRVVERR